MAVRIITDTACDIPQETADQLGIVLIPLSIRFGDEELIDREQLSAAEFWERCRTSATLPESAAPAPGRFQAAYEQAKADGCEGVVVITLSSDLSATYQSARAAAESVAPYPVTVLDSRAVTLGQGLLVIEAAEAAAQGADYASVVSLVRDTIPRVGMVGVLDTLEHLKKGGRIGSAQALLGSMLAIKPLLTLADGKVAEAGRARTRAKALDATVKAALAAGPFHRLGVAHGDAGDVDVVMTKLEGADTDTPILVSGIGPVVGTHAGPGIIGVCWITRA